MPKQEQQNNMKQHEPMCKMNISCAVYHSDGICPDRGVCTCKVEKPQNNKEEWFERFEKGYAWIFGHCCLDNSDKEDLKTFISQLLLEQREGIVQQIIKGVEDYKVPKEIKINKLGADYIFVYDLRTFILNQINKKHD